MEGDDYEELVGLVSAAEGIKINVEESSLKVTDVTMMGSVFDRALDITRGVLTMLNDELLLKERAIEGMLPRKNYIWEKNFTLKERLAQAVDMVSQPEKYGYKETLAELPRFLRNLDESVATIVAYNERKELLLNYPTALTAIQNQLGLGDQVSPTDLPFDARSAEEFLKLFYSHKYPEFSLDEETMVLAKKE